MSQAFCLLNHELTQNQIKELKEEFNVSQIIYPSKELSQLWSQIPPSKRTDKSIINKIISFLEFAKKDDVLIVQGDFASTFMIVDFALKNELIPICATTKRIAKESRQGEVVKREYIFEHVCFRKYEYYEN
ncbi:MAG: hypothetical protein J6J67_06850 [Treponema sp.]|nr:hypothetical protein [Treponema sp.]